MKRLLISIVFLYVYSIFWGNEIDYDLNVSNNTVKSGEIFQITLEIHNSSGVSVSLTDAPSGVMIKEAGRSSSFTIVNGQQTSSVMYTYLAKINQTGDFEIGPFHLKTRDGELDTEPIKVTVVDQPKTAQNSAKNGTGTSAGTDDYFVKIIPAKTTIYGNEYLDISVKFYSSAEVRVSDYKQMELPKTAWIEDINSSSDYRGKVVINGVNYDEYEIERKRIFITKPGTYNIKPVVMNLFVIARNAMFSFTTVPVTVQSDPVEINVQPLPEQNSPGNRGAGFPVGEFDLAYTVDHTVIQENKPVTLKVTLSGDGNFYAIDSLPIHYGKGLEVYSSKSDIIKKNNKPAAKVWEILLVPKKAGSIPVTIDEFTYFDPKTKLYTKLPQRSFTITVAANGEPASPDTQLFIKNSADPSEQTEKKEQKEFAFISNTLGKRMTYSMVEVNFYLIILTYGVLLISLIGGGFLYFVSRRVKAHAGGKPDKVLRCTIKNILQKGDASSEESVSDQLYVAFEKFIIARFELNSVNITKSTLAGVLTGKVPDEVINKMVDILTELDLIRFGGLDVTWQGLQKIADEIELISLSV